ncbi:MAG TPA: pyrroline-5-carboxylate reductase [Acidimicrobiales bacterium]|nr:pyrroline-5-carboxylate reductase [Acidimicrobiales bacterium]
MTQLMIVGGGKMGEALLAGLVRARWAAPTELAVVEPVAERRRQLTETFPGVDVRAEPAESAGAVIAVKPADVATAAKAISSAGCGRVLSIAAGVATRTIEDNLDASTPVVRAMPNTPALVGAGASAIALGAAASPEDEAWARSILAAVGIVVTVPEDQLDAVTGLSGSGPAYVFLVAEAMIDAGERAGLSRETAEMLAKQTLLGASRLMVETGTPPVELRAAVTSPNGTTVAGLAVLDERDVRGAFVDAVKAATERSRELGAQS